MTQSNPPLPQPQLEPAGITFDQYAEFTPEKLELRNGYLGYGGQEQTGFHLGTLYLTSAFSAGLSSIATRGRFTRKRSLTGELDFDVVGTAGGCSFYSLTSTWLLPDSSLDCNLCPIRSNSLRKSR